MSRSPSVMPAREPKALSLSLDPAREAVQLIASSMATETALAQELNQVTGVAVEQADGFATLSAGTRWRARRRAGRRARGFPR
jgi:hypothetical protein